MIVTENRAAFIAATLAESALRQLAAAGDARAAAALAAWQRPTEPPSASQGNGARDRLIRDMWRQHFAGSTPDQAARSIDRSASAYQANGWLRDRDRSTPPARLDGTAERFVFLALKTGRPFPGYARLRQILAC